MNFKRTELEVEDQTQQPKDINSIKMEPVRVKTGYAGKRASEKKWRKRKVDVLGLEQAKSAEDRVCCVKDSAVADANFEGVDFKSDDLMTKRGKMACQTSGGDPRNIPEVVRKAMDVKDPVRDVEGHILGVVDYKKGRKMMRDTSGCDPRDIPEVVRKATDVKDPVHDLEGHTPGVVDLEEGMKMVQGLSGADLRDIPEVVSEAMDVKVPVHDMEDHTPGEENVQEGRKMV